MQKERMFRVENFQNKITLRALSLFWKISLSGGKVHADFSGMSKHPNVRLPVVFETRTKTASIFHRAFKLFKKLLNFPQSTDDK